MSKETDESQSGTIEMNEIPNEKGTSLKYNRAPPYGVPKRKKNSVFSPKRNSVRRSPIVF